jgi:RNA polymerase sigma-70 factor (ECF subfamily)
MRKSREASQAIDSKSDEALMLEAMHARAAFAELIQRHQHALMNFFARLGDYTHAEDLTQETFIRVYRYRDRYKAKAKFTTFLYTLARRTWVDHRRKSDRRAIAYEAYAEECSIRQEKGSDATQERLQAMHAAMKELSDEMRACVVMSVYQGFKYHEIAEILEIPVGTVKTRVYHAMRKLRETLK